MHRTTLLIIILYRIHWILRLEDAKRHFLRRDRILHDSGVTRPILMLGPK